MRSSLVIFIKMKPLKFIFIVLVYWLATFIVHLLASSTVSTINPAMIDDEGLWTQNGTMYWSNACKFDASFGTGSIYYRNITSVEECPISNRSPSHVLHPYEACYIIPTRNWKVDRIGELGDGVLYQNNCDFDKKFDIENEAKFQKSLNNCVTHCFNLTRCTHFSYSERNRMCRVKKASALTDREKAGSDKWCGYIPSRWNLTDDGPINIK